MTAGVQFQGSVCHNDWLYVTMTGVNTRTITIPRPLTVPPTGELRITHGLFLATFFVQIPDRTDVAPTSVLLAVLPPRPEQLCCQNIHDAYCSAYTRFGYLRIFSQDGPRRLCPRIIGVHMQTSRLHWPSHPDDSGRHG